MSAQDARGVRALHPVPVENLREQLATLPWDAAGAVRIGAMATAENVRAVASALRSRPALDAVVDPVCAASHGGRLVDDDARREVAESLATLPNVVLTPNAGEAAALLGAHPLTRESIGGAAVALQQRGARAVLVTGGDLDGDPVDALATAAGLELFQRAAHRRRDARNRLHAGDGAGLRTRARHAAPARRRRRARVRPRGNRAALVKRYAP